MFRIRPAGRPQGKQQLCSSWFFLLLRVFGSQDPVLSFSLGAIQCLIRFADNIFGRCQIGSAMRADPDADGNFQGADTQAERITANSGADALPLGKSAM